MFPFPRLWGSAEADRARAREMVRPEGAQIAQFCENGLFDGEAKPPVEDVCRRPSGPGQGWGCRAAEREALEEMRGCFGGSPPDVPSVPPCSRNPGPAAGPGSSSAAHDAPQGLEHLQPPRHQVPVAGCPEGREMRLTSGTRRGQLAGIASTFNPDFFIRYQ